MKIRSIFFWLFTFIFFSCQEAAEKVIEAKEAKKRSDSIMQEFKKIDSTLKSNNAIK